MNKVSRPTKPTKAEAKASRILEVLLNGGIVNRKTLGDMNIATNNDSAHSLISILRNVRFVPIETRRQPDGTADYFMEAQEILRYKDPALRLQQSEEMKVLVEKKRHAKIIKRFKKFLDGLSKSLTPCASQVLEGIVNEICALLTNEKDAN